MAVRCADRRRLARLAMPLVDAERDTVERRAGHRRLVDHFQLIRCLLVCEGVDPERTCLMDRLREAEAELAAIPAKSALQCAEHEYAARVDTSRIDEEWERDRRYRPPPRQGKTFEGEVDRLIGLYRSDVQIDFAQASSADLFAWCLSRHGATMAEAAAVIAKAAKDLLLFVDKLPDDPTREDIERALLAEENQ